MNTTSNLDPALAQAALNVLEENWLGHATRPAPRLYPHQWSWDSAFIAIGMAHYDQARAQQELQSLFAGQWANGLLPHIIFNPRATRYAPGPDFWQSERSPHAPVTPQTSAIVQPPLHATAAWHVFQFATDRPAAQRFLRDLFPRLQAWHAYLYRARDCRGEGLVYIRHPWESGQDNSPIWDSALARMSPGSSDIPPYQRIDTLLVNAAERPSQAEYDYYAYLVGLFREHGHDEASIRAASPFLIEDVLFNSLLVQAGHDLAAIADAIGADGEPFRAQAERTTSAIKQHLWNDEHGIYFDYDLVTQAQIHAHVAAGFTPLFAGVPSAAQAGRLLANLNSHSFCPLDEYCLAVPSYDRLEPGFVPNRYWRGPIWMNVNWLLYRGLRRYGLDAYAERVREAMLMLPRQYGFYEYYEPDSGRGHGSEQFSWTAALLLDLLAEEQSL